LAEQFSVTARLSAEAVVNLAISGVSQEEYFRLCKLTEDAQIRAKAACVAFEEHVNLHRCFNGSSNGSSLGSAPISIRFGV
jgi:hypothetical protein